MKVLLIEDEALAAERLKKMLLSVEPGTEIVGVCNSIASSVAWLQTHPAPDLIFMDIELSDGKCFSIFQSVTITSPLIFVTAYDKHAIQAIKLNALDYLLKPVNKAEMETAIQKVRERAPAAPKEEPALKNLELLVQGIAQNIRPKKLAINTMEGSTFVELDNIIRLEADSNYTHIYLLDGRKMLVPRTLKEYDEILNGFGFCRIHSAHMVNVTYVEKYIKGDGGQVIMRGGKSIDVSKVKRADLMKALAIN
ncbi:MAG TPA: LytTR family DNA-binding domain-containing protein [Bacteroidia bacterium]|jgi:two-component system LytT family response regulator|nr:LytTR family DNA-binding domain-containing protein [Bacteroidia bacterium]